jgi:aryl-alcohol dehydrogenase-like predicted oxidoreductase
MESTTIGDKSIEISEITLGLWNLSGDDTWGDQREQTAIDTIHEAIDQGITTFDNAEMYGDGYAEELLGRALESVDRDLVTVTSKVTPDNLQYDDVLDSCNRSLERMNTDYIDIYYIHWPNGDVPFAKTFRALADLKREGRIREAAISNFGPKDIEEVVRTIERDSIDIRPVLNQVPYNLLFRAIEYEIVPRCVAHDVSITSYSSLLHGLLTGKFESLDEVPDERARTRHFSTNRPGTTHDEDGTEELTAETLASIEMIANDVGVPMEQLAIAWNLARPQIKSVIVGARSPEQVRQNAAAADLSLQEGTVERLNSATQELKSELGSNPDMWQSDSRYR